MASFFDKVLRIGEGRLLKELKVISDQVNRIEEDYTSLSDGELVALTDQYRKRLADGETADDLLPEAFATVREASMRTLHKRHYDVQIMGGAALHMGNIAEMRTGEGKTLVCTLPAYLNGLTGKGVHVVTVNDYLAQRDAEQMGRVHRFLGLSVGVLVPQQPSDQRRQQYAADITYGTNSEFGFDYLRDNMAMNAASLTQRGHHFAVVDEVDSILIDEARTPLIISGPADQPTKWYGRFATLAARMRRDVDYEVDEKKRTVGVLESGIEMVEDELGIENLYEAENTPLIQYLNNALKAKDLYKGDKDYVLMDGEVMIVDEHTGRVLAGRRYSEGMHQAIEAKEGVEIKQENQTLATITLQNFFRLYETLSGMTGTGMTEAAEFDKTYGLGVVQIPTNRPTIRKDVDDQIFKSAVTKYDAVVDDLARRHAKGQPVLVGTASVQSSEYLSGLLSKQGIRHEVLNAKHHEREASIVARAGHKGAVTVATNMAGRGTDIMLGGNPEFLADEELQARGIDPQDHLEQYEAEWPAVLEKHEKQVATEHEEVLRLGGLYVLGTERHESRRIDNQLRGRSGRQGDPGESKFYISLEDDLMRRFGGAVGLMERAMAMLPDDVPIESKSVTRSIQRAQGQAESQNFEIRKDVLKYDDVLNRQRQVIYGERRQVLMGEDIHEQVQHMLADVVTNYVRAATGEGYPEGWDLEQLWADLSTVVVPRVTIAEVESEVGGRDAMTPELLTQALLDDVKVQYSEREAEVGADRMRELEREVVLSVLDRKWREHLYEMDYLREGIGLRAMAQRNPLVEYQREGFDMFVAMTEGIKDDAIRLLFSVEVRPPEEAPSDGGTIKVAKGLLSSSAPRNLEYTAPTVDGDAKVEHRTEEGDEQSVDVPTEVGPARGKRTRKSGSRKRR